MLLLCATPIGNLGDLTPRVREALTNCDAVYCEDTRRTLTLLNHIGIKKPLVSCYRENERQRAEDGVVDVVGLGHERGLGLEERLEAFGEPFDELGVVGRGGEVECARLQRGDGFTAGRREAEDVGGPGIDFLALDGVPAPPFPGAEIDLAQARVDAHRRLRGQLPRQPQRAPRRARIHRDARRETLPQVLRDGFRRVAIHVEASVADAGFDDRRRMTDQENLHSRPL